MAEGLHYSDFFTGSERWRQVTEVFHAARSRDAVARASYLEYACAGDGALRAEVDAMLAAHHDPGGFGDRPVSGSVDASGDSIRLLCIRGLRTAPHVRAHETCRGL